MADKTMITSDPFGTIEETDTLLRSNNSFSVLYLGRVSRQAVDAFCNLRMSIYGVLKIFIKA
tara:strand:- start:629 stop:814 length:186 start_codon:yes stop_codon:yes gene_type:complete